MATPSVPPSSRVVSLTAEPTPAFSAGNDPMIASVAGAITMPSPPAMKPIEMTIIQYGTSTAKLALRTNPTAIGTGDTQRLPTSLQARSRSRSDVSASGDSSM